ncbi:glutamine amidotransferase-related protein [Methylobacterium sp. J-068]|uniref:glutamine amidotransferase-related protein n=1 Tax=Methylobacterium sp. J-068 TaxID=2836649 RepID=UPI001FBA979A|nr:gamma-glutamyl-gamma-aminobutyrate hydrolase family protein [Methylobacterium sp. J-068]MCJ2033954.1 gamma-glutamyl-gamma-aminobutyrate hydrolase family protein [Methylobacterium sp. J-068]
MLRLLVADGNDRAGRAAHVEAAGVTSAEAYAAILRQLAPGAVCTLIDPADADAALPAGTRLGDFDALFVTGSALHIREGGAAVRRQIALMRQALGDGLPVFGSCWGVQVAAVVAGGEAARNPKGPEYGFSRDLTRTAAGATHPLLAGRGARFDAPAMHLDAVIVPPAHATVLAGNQVLSVQAIEIVHGPGVFWGTQYHPELDLDALAAMLRLSADDVVEAGARPDHAAVEAYAADLCRIHVDPEAQADRIARHRLGADLLDPARRRTEIANFLAHCVRPRVEAAA